MCNQMQIVRDALLPSIDIDVPNQISCDFVVRCEDSSMVGARIYPGDLVYIRRCSQVENGELAAVLIEDTGRLWAIIRRVFVFADCVLLKPENNTQMPMVYAGKNTERVRILGKAVAFTSRIT